ncbi:carboxypeptidase regulatory-like domain-containing protein [Gimesia panareensis]|uniref:carboxypeptidase regulatory-like domain-containing protein n=1 Tax=Gimesia panareensis TaxID=2527978 RepID=UPI001189BD34|nr:carboxypeptidase regulatory-like domain-containing protein [Gimesia panareensis]QDU48521.1 hypothetical protein Pan110_08360 [Gimesia panareensis]
MYLAGKQAWCFLLGMLCLTLVGCGGTPSDQPDLGTVTGTVTMNDKPLPGVMVVFSPESGRSSMGLTNDAGEYELEYVGDTKGAKVGQHKISITTAQSDSSEESGGEESGAPTKETIPPTYNTQTILSEEVKPGENIINFTLTSE